MTLSPRMRAFLLTSLFVVSFVLRSYQPVSRPAQWYYRSRDFYTAISKGNWENTYHRRHPGVTVMLIDGLTLHLYDVVQDSPAEAIFSWAEAPTRTLYGRAVAAGVMGLAFVISALIVLNTALLARVTNWITALAAGGLMVFSPYYLAHSRVLHLDALVSTLMLTSALLILIYFAEGNLRYLLLSGLVAGLAILTKVPALFLLPYTGLTLLVRLILRLRGDWGDNSEGRTGWVLGETWRMLVLPGLLWIGMSLIPWAAWPAMWVRPAFVMQKMFTGTLSHVEQSHSNTRFFAGNFYDDTAPPITFYPVTLIYNASFVSLLFAVLAITQYIFWAKRAEKPAAPPIFWLLVAYIGFFITQMAISAKQVDRYIMPAHVMLEIVAAVGIAGYVDLMRRAVKASARMALALPSVVVIAAVGLQALTALPYAPNYGAHHNTLTGANLGAVKMIEIMGQDEGTNYVGEYLARQPDSDNLVVGATGTVQESLNQYFEGERKSVGRSQRDFYIFDISAFQRGGSEAQWRKQWDKDFQHRTPQLVVRFGGVDYLTVFADQPDETQGTILIERGFVWMIAGSWLAAAALALTTALALRRV